MLKKKNLFSLDNALSQNHQNRLESSIFEIDEYVKFQWPKIMLNEPIPI